MQQSRQHLHKLQPRKKLPADPLALDQYFELVSHIDEQRIELAESRLARSRIVTTGARIIAETGTAEAEVFERGEIDMTRDILLANVLVRATAYLVTTITPQRLPSARLP